MRRPIKTRTDLEITSDHFLRRNPGHPIGVTLTELDYLRGHTDDFLGDQLEDEYTPFGAGTVAIVIGHGGWIRIATAAVAGDATGITIGQINPSNGVVFGTRLKLGQLTDISFIGGSYDAAWTNGVFFIYDSAVSPNWRLLTRVGGVTTDTNTGIAADTNAHWHWFEVSSIQARYWIDARLGATNTTNIPNLVLINTVLRLRTGVDLAKHVDIDFWGVIPRNL